MKLGSIFKKLGSAALKSIPGVGSVVEILGFVNDILPKDKALTVDSTGDEAMQAVVSSLSSEQEAEVLQKKFDVEIEEIRGHVQIIQALAEVDNNGKSTRPAIARLFAWNTVVICDLIVAGIVYAVVKDQVNMLAQIKECWPLILGLLGPFIALINSYFGRRSKEKAQKYEAVSGTGIPACLLTKAMKAFGRK